MDATLIYSLYRALQWAAFPFILLYFAWRIIKHRPYYRRFPERLGFLPQSFQQFAGGTIWLHAVSVGEILSTLELARRLKARLPSVPLFVSTTTLAGRELADRRLSGMADGVFFAPIDYCFAVRRVLRTLRPAVVVVAETEIWPNLYREAKRSRCGLAIVNGRISDRVEPRYRRFAWFFRRVLRWPDAILAQSEVSRRRYLALGAPEERVLAGGNLKYDQARQAAMPEPVRLFLEGTQPGEIWIAASTMPPTKPGDVDEDDAVIEAFQALAANHPEMLLVLAPRKPERFEVAAEKLREKGIPFTRRSGIRSDMTATPLPAVLLLDSMGELASLFELDSVVFTGGSLAQRGGHNLLEPAFLARPIVVGPHMENFPEIATEFEAGGGCLRIEGPQELSGAIDRLLRDPELRLRVGRRARELAEAKGGATDRAVRVIMELHDRSVPRHLPAAPAYPLLWLASCLWRAGSAWKRRWDQARNERLDTPVISVGGLAMGGSGKTPFVLWLAQRLKQAGRHPAILTRGYRRRTAERQTLFEPGASAPAEITGDEGQILLRAGLAPLGIGRDRASVGRAIEQRFHPDTLILDDGFQHWRLQRDLDIVLVDASDTFGGGYVFPLGRLREPPEALARAGLLVITRTEEGRSYRGLEAELRRYNPRAPILQARVTPQCWIDFVSDEHFRPEELPSARVAAFCALGNPASFWRTLASLGYRPMFRWPFGDHHRYRPVDLRRLASEARRLGAAALVTTEKDVMNLCDNAPDLIAPLRLYWLRIGVEVQNQQNQGQYTQFPIF